MGKFNARSDEGIFVGYLAKIKGYRVFLHKLGKVITSSDVRIDENWKTMQNGEVEDNEEDDFNVDEESDQPEEKEQEVSLDSEKSESEQEERDPLTTKMVQGRRTKKTWTSAHRGDQIIGDPSAGVTTRRRMVGLLLYSHKLNLNLLKRLFKTKLMLKLSMRN